MFERKIAVWRWARGGTVKRSFGSDLHLGAARGHPFYQRLNQLLAEHDFDRFVEAQCRRFYAAVLGQPGLAPGIYFRLLLVGYFEGIDSDRGIAWRAGDSLSIRELVGIPLDEKGAGPHHDLADTAADRSRDPSAGCWRGCWGC